MKFFILLALFASVLICKSVRGDDVDLTEVAEKDSEIVEDFFSMMPFLSDPEVAAPAIPGGETYRRCIKIRCPINCRICICRCIKWA